MDHVDLENTEENLLQAAAIDYSLVQCGPQFPRLKPIVDVSSAAALNQQTVDRSQRPFHSMKSFIAHESSNLASRSDCTLISVKDNYGMGISSDSVHTFPDSRSQNLVPSILSTVINSHQHGQHEFSVIETTQPKEDSQSQRSSRSYDLSIVGNINFGKQSNASFHSSNAVNDGTPCTSSIKLQGSDLRHEKNIVTSPQDLHCRSVEGATEFSNDKNHTVGESHCCCCERCGEIFDTVRALQKHKYCHHLMKSKKNILTLKQKVEIIERIKSGEKKSALAEEFGMNLSSIKTIMKKSDAYLRYLKCGLFTPNRKKLKSAMREDLEQALYLWYKNAQEKGLSVSGPVLCSKAVDFALELGHSDFKPSNGWLDRFKKRRNISISRASSKRQCDEPKSYFSLSLLTQLLTDFDANDVFALDVFGMFFRALPSSVAELKNEKCAGGIMAKSRLSVALCTNMTGSDKCPLLVVGASDDVMLRRAIRNLALYYVQEENSWFTYEIILAWLQDLDSWFVERGRKVLFVVPASPILSRITQASLLAIKLVIMPPTFRAPLRRLVLPFFKIFYRKLFLTKFLLLASKNSGQRANLDTLEVPLNHHLDFINSSWQAVPPDFIVASFNQSGITKIGVWEETATLIDISGRSFLAESIKKVCEYLSQPSLRISVDDYLNFDDNLQACNLMEDGDILAKIVRRSDLSENDEVRLYDKQEESVDSPLLSEVERALAFVRNYIQYQENAQEMFAIFANLEYCIYKRNTESGVVRGDFGER